MIGNIDLVLDKQNILYDVYFTVFQNLWLELELGD